MTLHIARGLDLPDDALTQTFGILARKGAGKTYTGAVLAEELIKAGLQVVVLDPLGAWWGLRAAANGRDPGLPVTILGGDHGDIPLEPTAGRVVADLVVDNPASVVIDVSAFDSNAAQDRFVADFAERLYRAKNTNRRPLHLLIDEADSFAPQKPRDGQQRMLGAFESIVRRGRIRGLGCTLITQRPAVLNKNVLTQVECLVVLQMTAPQDRKAIDDWVVGNGTKEQRDELLASLASLGVGEAWFWSPAWLKIFQRVKVRRRDTFDSSATPTAGVTPVEPKRLADVDLAQLRERMAATIERAQADDPKRLRARIAELEKQTRTTAAPERVVERVEIPIVPPDLLDELRALRADAAKLTDLGLELAGHADRTLAAVERAANAAPPPPRAPAQAQRSVRVQDRVQETRREVTPPTDAPNLRAGERRILETLARHHPMRVTKAQLGTLAKFKITGGTFSAYWAHLRRENLVEETGGLISLTDTGLATVGHVPTSPLTTDEILDQWRRALRAGERRMLDELVAAYPDPIDRNDLAARLDMTATGGTYGAYLGNLRRNGLATIDGQQVRASDTLFLG